MLIIALCFIADDTPRRVLQRCCTGRIKLNLAEIVTLKNNIEGK